MRKAGFTSSDSASRVEGGFAFLQPHSNSRKWLWPGLGYILIPGLILRSQTCSSVVCTAWLDSGLEDIMMENTLEPVEWGRALPPSSLPPLTAPHEHLLGKETPQWIPPRTGLCVTVSRPPVIEVPWSHCCGNTVFSALACLKGKSALNYIEFKYRNLIFFPLTQSTGPKQTSFLGFNAKLASQ